MAAFGHSSIASGSAVISMDMKAVHFRWHHLIAAAAAIFLFIALLLILVAGIEPVPALKAIAVLLLFYFAPGLALSFILRIDDEDRIIFSIISSFLISGLAIITTTYASEAPALHNMLILDIAFTAGAGILAHIVRTIGEEYMPAAKAARAGPTRKEDHAVSIHYIIAFCFAILMLAGIILFARIDKPIPVSDDWLIYKLEKDYYGKPYQLINTWSPMLYYTFGMQLYPVLGTSEYTMALVDGLLLIVLILSMYKIGEHLISRDAGLICAAVTAFIPSVFAFSRVSFYEFPLMCAVWAAFYFLLKTNRLTSPAYSMASGLALAVSAGIKTLFFVYLALPYAFYLISSFITAKPGRISFDRKAWPAKAWCLSLMLLSFLIPAYAIYSPNLGEMLLHIAEIRSRAYTLFNPLYYFNNVLTYNLLLPLTLIAIACLAALAFKRTKVAAALAACIAFPYILLNIGLPLDQTVRYGIQVLPAFSLIIAYAISLIEPKERRVAVAAILILLAAIQFIHLSFFTCSLPATALLSKELRPLCSGNIYHMVVLRYNIGSYGAVRSDLGASFLRDAMSPYIIPDTNRMYCQDNDFYHLFGSLALFGGLSHIEAHLGGDDNRSGNFEFAISQQDSIDKVFPGDSGRGDFICLGNVTYDFIVSNITYYIYANKARQSGAIPAIGPQG